ncbi:MAG: anaerobic ribonucleoside-triphosphate reductase activating protein [Burkholderiales bacterium]|nr:anaerobic ribonucleoside-triphosphate reductase activating protein [Pseudomonadota bacterium]MCC7069180.1 anaerobic ribonucleoside-triphosphate reductase activating protein [Burkholderiales bacterium]
MTLRVGGITPLTTIDFPGHLAAVVYCQGCPWRCTYCHNPELLDATAQTGLAWAQVMRLLERRVGLLDGVVFSGGEPTLQNAIGEAMDAVRALGFRIALHTGGMYPERLRAVLGRLDWVGLDIKALPEDYGRITASGSDARRTDASLDMLVESAVAFECRTTWHAGLFSVDALLRLARRLHARGVRHWTLQECRSTDAPAWQLDEPVLAQLREGFERFTLRLA